MERETSLLDKANPTFFKKHQTALLKALEDKHTTVEL
jgi:hypothetical protein